MPYVSFTRYSEFMANMSSMSDEYDFLFKGE